MKELKEMNLLEITKLYEATGFCFPVNDGIAKAAFEGEGNEKC